MPLIFFEHQRSIEIAAALSAPFNKLNFLFFECSFLKRQFVESASIAHAVYIQVPPKRSKRLPK
ncbi:hypothetical protein DLM78_06755 [Leptospira stimsonii]|uniref:Uncharacterized protein n=1 Tax=Leptospira stimsonii TaxID=2202203 RepID=A0A8B3CWT9_9LEPT|nr:hypothetical protein DLM78_06755 [Leptospira stimsonii]